MAGFNFTNQTQRNVETRTLIILILFGFFSVNVSGQVIRETRTEVTGICSTANGATASCLNAPVVSALASDSLDRVEYSLEAARENDGFFDYGYSLNATAKDSRPGASPYGPDLGEYSLSGSFEYEDTRRERSSITGQTVARSFGGYIYSPRGRGLYEFSLQNYVVAAKQNELGYTIAGSSSVVDVRGGLRFDATGALLPIEIIDASAGIYEVEFPGNASVIWYQLAGDGDTAVDIRHSTQQLAPGLINFEILVETSAAVSILGDFSYSKANYHEFYRDFILNSFYDGADQFGFSTSKTAFGLSEGGNPILDFREPERVIQLLAVQAVPVPPAWVLLAGGIAGLRRLSRSSVKSFRKVHQ